MQSKLLMKEFVIGLLKDKLPVSYLYHNPKHTLYVHEIAEEIGRYEGCSEKELELLKAAALWHDTGYTKTYTNHEEESCMLARQYLPEFGFSAVDIDQVCGMIMATKIPQSPKNKLEEIVADADLEYLGTASFEIKSDNLYKELHTINPLLSEINWSQMQISFLEQHHYFTRYCQENREHIKQIHLNKLLHRQMGDE